MEVAHLATTGAPGCIDRHLLRKLGTTLDAAARPCTGVATSVATEICDRAVPPGRLPYFTYCGGKFPTGGWATTAPVLSTRNDHVYWSFPETGSSNAWNWVASQNSVNLTT